MIVIAKYSIVLFGLFLIFSSFLMFFKPEKTRQIIGKAGSTYLINFLELGCRLLVGIAFIISSKIAIYELQFKVVGYFLVVSALVIMCIPIKKHNAFSKRAAEKLKPSYLKICGLFSLFLGYIILFSFKN